MNQQSTPEVIVPVLPLGRIVGTPGAVASVSPQHMFACLKRHEAGDWGSVCREDWQTNDHALRDGMRVLSAYAIDPRRPCRGFGDNCLWIITEADRSVTTLLLPEEY